MITLSDAARILGVQPGTLRRQVHLGKLKARKQRIGGYSVWTVTQAELERYARENKR